MSTIINPIYKEIFEKDFNYGDFQDRLKMQKSIYLLENMGVNVGDYGFFWYKHGPYSQDLQDDMFYFSRETATAPEPLVLSPYSNEKIHLLKDVVEYKRGLDTKYSDGMWLEALASLYYLKNNVIGNNATDENLVDILEQKKPHLNEKKTNLIAVEALYNNLFKC